MLYILDLLSDTCQTMLVGISVMLILPNNITTARFLREEERALALQRLRGVEHGTGDKEVYELYSPLVAHWSFLSIVTYLGKKSLPGQRLRGLC